MRRRAKGGVFRQIDDMLEMFEQQKKETREHIRARFGSKAGRLHISGSWWCCRYKGRVHRGMTPAALLARLAATQAEATRE